MTGGIFTLASQEAAKRNSGSKTHPNLGVDPDPMRPFHVWVRKAGKLSLRAVDFLFGGGAKDFWRPTGTV